MDVPAPRGPLSHQLVGLLRGEGGAGPQADLERQVVDPLADDDLNLALWICNELSYRGFEAVPDELEWDAGLLAWRRALERVFMAGLRASVQRGDDAPPDVPVAERLQTLIAADAAPSVSRFLERTGTRDQFREFVVHRSVYHLKEADPHSWGLPRLSGRAKAALVTIQADEYGSGLLAHMHSELFRVTMRALGLDDTYGHYVDTVPGVTLAISNLMSLFGLHRSLRGALAGHLAVFEMTSSSPNRRYSRALRRLGGDAASRRFYDVHITADALHEQLAAVDLCGGLVADEPDLLDDVMFGAACALHLDGAWSAHLLECWNAGRSSLRATATVALAGSAG